MDNEKNEKILLEEFKAAQKHEIAVINELAKEAQKTEPSIMNLRKLREKFKNAHEASMKIFDQILKFW